MSLPSHMLVGLNVYDDESYSDDPAEIMWGKVISCTKNGWFTIEMDCVTDTNDNIDVTIYPKYIKARYYTFNDFGQGNPGFVGYSWYDKKDRTRHHMRIVREHIIVPQAVTERLSNINIQA